jgi:hypothetical protein
MLNKTIVVGLLLSVLTLVTFTNSADARRCPRGQHDVHDVCVPGHR